jgi:peptidoglycan/LPS O-acetylase OafA/YrhL
MTMVAPVEDESFRLSKVLVKVGWVGSGPMPGDLSAATTARPKIPREAAGGRRLAWLDALRGLAALCVVYAHFGTRVLPQVHTAVYDVFDPGLSGVLVFFLISGYIVPASLERRGSVRTFWISRIFRLFPLFVFAIGAVLLLHEFGWASVRDANQNVTASVFSHIFMLNELLGETNIIVVLWTLSYEMVFYVLLTALFTAGLHKRSGWYAGTFAVGALLLGGLLPTFFLSYSSFGLTPIAVAGDICIVGGLAVAVATRGLPRALGAWVAAATGLVLVAVNGRKSPYEGLTILALMFTGTMLYRAEQGQIGRSRATIVAIGIFGTRSPPVSGTSRGPCRGTRQRSCSANGSCPSRWPA